MSVCVSESVARFRTTSSHQNDLLVTQHPPSKVRRRSGWGAMETLVNMYNSSNNSNNSSCRLVVQKLLPEESGLQKEHARMVIEYSTVSQCVRVCATLLAVLVCGQEDD